MIKINTTRRFTADVAHAIFYLAEHNPRAADRYLSLIDETIRFLQDNPRIGEARHHLGMRIHKLSIPPYQLFYRIDENQITLLRLLHSSQRICKAMFST